MKNRCFSLIIVVAVVVAAGCNDALLSPETPEEDPLARYKQSYEAFYQADHLEPALVGSTAPVYAFAEPEGSPVGKSWLMRTPNGIGFRVEASGLAPRSAVTLWAIIFNSPEHCTPAEENGPPSCGEDDFFNADARVDVFYASGGLARPNGRVGLGGIRRIGDGGGSLWAILGLSTPGLIDAKQAEILFVVRDHGPAIPERVWEMTHTYNGGCEQGDLPPEPGLGTPGPNTCVDAHFAMHRP